jgi:hypothetical protein
VCASERPQKKKVGGILAILIYYYPMLLNGKVIDFSNKTTRWGGSVNHITRSHEVAYFPPGKQTEIIKPTCVYFIK